MPRKNNRPNKIPQADKNIAHKISPDVENRTFRLTVGALLSAIVFRILRFVSGIFLTHPTEIDDIVLFSLLGISCVGALIYTLRTLFLASQSLAEFPGNRRIIVVNVFVVVLLLLLLGLMIGAAFYLRNNKLL